MGCHKPTVIVNRCDRFYCPMCTSRLSFRRRLSVEFWTRQVKEPKHLVLTVRNRNSLSKTYVQSFKINLSKLRRSKVFNSVRGGLVSMEVTNEGKGWHLHSHLLLDSPFLDVKTIARKWASLVGQDFAIVCIKDVRNKSYLSEVTKYAVKGSQLAAWTGNEIAEFIDAFTGVRTFSVFGTLFKDRAKRQQLLNKLGPRSMSCPHCESEDFWYLDTNEWTEYECTGRVPKHSYA